MEELKWQWWQQVDKVKWKCDSMFLALEEPMKMGLAWFVFSLSPFPHPSTKVMTSQLAISWVCVTSMFASEIAATTRQSDGRVMLQLHTTCIRCNNCNDGNTNWSKGGRKVDGNKKGSRYNWSSLCWGKKHGDMVPWSRKDGALSTCRKLVTTMVFYSTWYSQVWFQNSK